MLCVPQTCECLLYRAITAVYKLMTAEAAESEGRKMAFCVGF